MPDPTQVLLEPSIRVHLDGRLSGLTDDARRTVAVLGLNSPNLVRWRLTWMRIIDICQKNDPELFASLMGYPDEMPDLSILTPPGNTHPEGIERSYYAQRAGGRLSDGFIVSVTTDFHAFHIKQTIAPDRLRKRESQPCCAAVRTVPGAAASGINRFGRAKRRRLLHCVGKTPCH
ncbi:hypothetical protein [Planctomycetes bacterium CA13]|uniref:hypothetical protein n=1 Tax=Novipirellula herctigrandis TaxID=2527986 RepID=UPI0011B68ADE